ncbi:TetR family transcriptional regulator [Nocardia terpenica]|uniref:TetR family transcriptional regulator n=1 Tax=Nocardia terpenica TaxID=455432 RepID=A0A6G9ZG92_9NOCA|nr:TetR family transcriptional regulator [Nocardia terpenica]
MATRDRILTAAASVLAESGWRAATTDKVARRAGVTRGAIQHHFTDRDGLFTAAIQHLFDTRIAEFQTAARDFPQGPGRTLAIVRAIVELHQGESFAATLQLCVAAAGDPALRPRVADMELQMGIKAFWGTIDYLDLDGTNHTVRSTVQAFLDSARGLGLAGFIADDTTRREHITHRWAEMLDDLPRIDPTTNEHQTRSTHR